MDTLSKVGAERVETVFSRNEKVRVMQITENALYQNPLAFGPLESGVVAPGLVERARSPIPLLSELYRSPSRKPARRPRARGCSRSPRPSGAPPRALGGDCKKQACACSNHSMSGAERTRRHPRRARSPRQGATAPLSRSRNAIGFYYEIGL